jgi:hypothetical protein
VFIDAAMLYIDCGFSAKARNFQPVAILDAEEVSTSHYHHCTFARGRCMTAVEVLFRYEMSPGEMEMTALGQVSDVYGIRRVRFSELERTVRVEYDATRLNESSVEKLLRSAGFDIREKLALA